MALIPSTESDVFESFWTHFCWRLGVFLLSLSRRHYFYMIILLFIFTFTLHAANQQFRQRPTEIFTYQKCDTVNNHRWHKFRSVFPWSFHLQGIKVSAISVSAECSSQSDAPPPTPWSSDRRRRWHSPILLDTGRMLHFLQTCFLEVE